MRKSKQMQYFFWFSETMGQYAKSNKHTRRDYEHFICDWTREPLIPPIFRLPDGSKKFGSPSAVIAYIDCHSENRIQELIEFINTLYIINPETETWEQIITEECVYGTEGTLLNVRLKQNDQIIKFRLAPRPPDDIFTWSNWEIEMYHKTYDHDGQIRKFRQEL